MKRRELFAGLLAVPAMPIVAMARPEALTTRKAVFEEVGEDVRMTIDLPSLIRSRDTDALKSIDSSFDTTLRYSMRVWEYGTREMVTSRVVVVKIRRDPWKKRYVVSRRGESGWTKRFFEKRDAAVTAATSLARQKIASVGQLERSEEGGPYYFVELLALRNPIDDPADKDARAQGRGGGRDLEWFSRLVDTLAGERARAEKVVHIRTNPFYLVP
ncbi:MAG: hypothetical protein ACRBN8_31450 [Nannocystales bacterium]